MGLLWSLSACTGGGGPARTADQIVRPLADDVVVMEYQGGKITAGDVNDQVNAQAKQFADELLDTYKKAAEQQLIMKLVEAEAKKQGLSSPQELMSNIGQDVTISDEEVKQFIKDNNLEKGIPGQNGELRQVSDEEVRGFLVEQQMRSAQENFFGELRTNAKARFKLEKPRTKVVSTGKEPFRGGANAKVVIHEFSDFQCPFCSRGNETVKKIVTEYGDKIKLVFRHMPLNFHPEAEPAAVATMCAHNQDKAKFWELHDKMFDNQSALGTESYKKWAEEIGLDMEKFNNCFDNKETLAAVTADVDAARSMGVNSTPTFFVNGKKIAGALPFAQFKSMIDEELANAN